MARLVAKGRTAYSLSQPEDGSSTAEAPYFHPDAWLEKTPFEHADFSADVSVDEPGRCNYRCAIDPEWQRAGLLAGEARTPARAHRTTARLTSSPGRLYSHSDTTLYISFVIRRTKHTGWRQNDFDAHAY